ncbi:hypothetical protein ACFQU2_22630 [Siccirubricoccus deserti]|uniref:Uncharacterized protein n=1 Tax=Siccirubricoccus deserti TaxID=2013562 RepID=A0A9X0UDL7_9PROT|nr:hypothetical protein [Siccirubricoccus deserti]MBC4015733.1 hypothetical protein [Siccirubricoccus deserti]
MKDLRLSSTPPDELPAPGRGRFDILPLPADRLLLLRYLGEVRTDQVMDLLGAALREQPEIATWGVVSDLRRHIGHLPAAGLNAISALRRNAWPDPPPAREVLLSFDPGMIFIARYLDHLLPHIAHSVGTDPAAACRLVMGPSRAVPEAALKFLATGAPSGTGHG